MHRDFTNAQDLAQELGYPDNIDESISKLFALQEDRKDLETRCAKLRDGLQSRIDQIKQLSSAKPDEMSSFIGSLDPKVQVFLVRLIPRVFTDRQSMLDFAPQYKELILEDLRYLDRGHGPSLTQEQANSEEMSRLSAEASLLKNDKNELKIENNDVREAMKKLESKYESTKAHSEKRKAQRDEFFAEAGRLVRKKSEANKEKIKAHREFLDERKHYKSLQTTSEEAPGREGQARSGVAGVARCLEEEGL
jgi:hypothetical protein